MVKIKGWWLPTQNQQSLVVCGPLRNLTQHYVQQFRSSAACLAPGECILCQKQYPIQVLNALPVKLPEQEEIYLLRIYPNQQHLLNLFSDAGTELIGRVIQVEKCPGQIKLRSLIYPTKKRIPTNPPPMENYLRALGRKAYDRMILDIDAQTHLTI